MMFDRIVKKIKIPANEPYAVPVIGTGLQLSMKNEAKIESPPPKSIEIPLASGGAISSSLTKILKIIHP